MKTYIIEIWNHILVDIEIMNPHIKFLYIMIDIRNKFLRFHPSYMVQYMKFLLIQQGYRSQKK